MRFYSIQPSEISEIDNDLINQLFLALPSLEAHEQLMAFKVADWPNMKDEARNKLYRSLNKSANPVTLREEARAITTQELASILNQG